MMNRFRRRVVRSMTRNSLQKKMEYLWIKPSHKCKPTVHLLSVFVITVCESTDAIF